MAESLGEAVLALKADLRDLEKGLAEGERKTEKSAKSMGAKFKGGLKRAMVPAIAVLAGAGAVAKTATDAASNLGEEINKTGVVFGKSAPKIHTWSKTTASGLGISQRAALEAAGTFGNMLVPMGLARGKAAAMSKSMVTLAADMASFNNASPEEVLEALRSGLAGETEPLRKFGVFLNAARIEQEAMNLGLVKGNQELTAAQKAQATYSIILKDTKDAQGDFAKTSDSAANATRIQAAETENLQAKIGQGLLPVYQTLQQILLTVTGFLSRHTGEVKVATVAIVGLAAAVVAINAGMKVAAAATVALAGAQKVVTAAMVLFNLALLGSPIAIFIIALAALAVAVGLADSRLFGLAGSTDDAAQSQREFRQALDGSRTALDKYRQSVDSVKDANIAHRGSVLNLRQAEANLRQLRRSGTATNLQLKQAEHQVRVARREVQRTTQNLNTVENRATEDRRTALAQLRTYLPVLSDRARREQNTIGLLRRSIAKEREAGASKTELRGKVQALKEMMDQHAGTTNRLSARIRELRDSSIPASARLRIMRGVLNDLESQGEGSTQQVRELRQQINRLKSKTVTVGVEVHVAPGPPGQGPRPGDGWGVEDAAGLAVQRAANANPARFFGGIPLGEGSGAFHAFDPIAAMFGAGLSSGFRPGAVTRSGNQSYHALNRAGDYSGGNMLGFAHFMATVFGSRLKELIHTPLGFSIKDGQQVAPFARSDHFNHVHVALEKGGMMLRSGLALVGEKGPEIAALPAGTRVFPHDDTKRLLERGGGRGDVHVHGPITINDRFDLDVEVGRLGWKLATAT